jgi:peptidoglycan-associated lipoprotein
MNLNSMNTMQDATGNRAGSFRGMWNMVCVALLVAASTQWAGCSKKEEVQPDENPIPSAALADENTMGDSDSGKAAGLLTVRFPYDSFELDAEAKQVLNDNSQILKDKPSMTIQIEGHCDERGGIQYNLALGEKRANSVKKMLQDLGIAANRISTISFGKERPLDQGKTDAAFAKNRRANFVITAR